MNSSRGGFVRAVLVALVCCILSVPFTGCVEIAPAPPPASDSGVHKATATVQTGSDGLTVEQRNIVDRLKADNQHGSIKHLYILSAYSGQCLIYSTVRGKVTSSGKRLTPNSVLAAAYGTVGYTHGIDIQIGGHDQVTSEVLQDDGTYGSSVEYIYWWDSKGIYHQQYITGGMIVHVSSEPISVKGVTINLESS